VARGDLVVRLLVRGSKAVSSPCVVEEVIIEKIDEIPPVSLELFEKYKKKMDFSNLPVYFSRDACLIVASASHARTLAG